jgi:hypothetical protein
MGLTYYAALRRRVSYWCPSPLQAPCGRELGFDFRAKRNR